MSILGGLCFSFTAGVFSGLVLDGAFVSLISFVLLLALLIKLIAFDIRKSSVTYSVIGTFFIFTAIFGMLYSYNTKESDRVFAPLYGTEVSVSGETVYISPNKDYFEIETDLIYNDELALRDCGRVRVYGAYGNRVKIRDVVTFTGKLYGGEEPKYYGGYNSFINSRASGIYGTIYAKEIKTEFNRIRYFDYIRLGHNLRSFLISRIELIGSGVTTEFLKALLAGDKSGFDSNTKLMFSNSGLSHVVAVSGLHLSVFVSMFCSWFYIYRNKAKGIIAVSLAIALYCIVTGGSPSVLRAGIMNVLGVAIAYGGMRRNHINTLGMSTAILCAFNPYLVMSVSFQLSVVSTLGLIMFMSRAKNNSILTTVSVILPVSPFCAYYFNSVALGALFGNLIVSPLVVILLPLGYLTCFIMPLKVITVPLANIILAVIEAFGSLDELLLSVSTPTPLFFIFYFSLVMLIYGFIKGKGKQWKVYFIIIACIALCITGIKSYMLKDTTAVYVLSDMIYIETNDGYNILTELNKDNESYYFLNKNNIDYVDLVITRADDYPLSDAVLNGTEAGKVYVRSEAEAYEEKYRDDLAKIQPVYYNNGKFELGNTVISFDGDFPGIYCDGKPIPVNFTTDGRLVTYYIRNGEVKYKNYFCGLRSVWQEF